MLLNFEYEKYPMKIKRIFYLSIISFFLMAPAYTQDKSNADKVVAKMEKVLKLTQQQVDSLRPIVTEYTAKRQQLIQNFKDKGTIDKSRLHLKLKQLKEEENQKLSQVLTHAQIKQWTDHQALAQIMNRDEFGNITGSSDMPNEGGVAF